MILECQRVLNPEEKLIFLHSQKRRPVLCGIAGWVGSRNFGFDSV